MALSILNNIASKTAENALSSTQASLQKTLTQLSTGLKINSGSDDAAGLSIAAGMQANISALTQSEQNASNGVGMLQTADGALSQVTSLLNRAVTLATEGSTSGITGSQSTALDTEFQSILTEINQIGQTTDFNGANVFASNQPTAYQSGSTTVTAATALATGSTFSITDGQTGSTFVYTAAAGKTVADLNTAIGAAVTSGVLSSGITAGVVAGQETISGGPTQGITVSTTAAALGGMVAEATAGNTNTVYIGDGVTTGAANTEIQTAIATLSATTLNLSTNSLTNSANAGLALNAVTTAINQVSAQRGVIGASVNRLTAATTNMSNEVTNLQSAANSIQNADIGTTVANMTQYNVLQSTGMAALQQANQAQQAVLKLVQ
jgi:flagellin